jgi:hypothetical protein
MASPALEEDAGFAFDPDKHEYRERGRLVPSATQLLKSCGMYNFDMVAPEILERKRQLGKLVHQACHFFDENDLPDDVHPEIAERLDGYKQFRLDTGYTPIINEFQQIGCINGMKFGMQFDSIGHDKHGTPWIVDIKNSSGASRAWGLQLALYDMAIPKPEPPHRHRMRIAVQLLGQGKYRLHTFNDPIDYVVAQSCLAIVVWKQNNKIAI